MSYKYTLKDVLLEAGVKEFYSIPDDNSWVRSAKHKKAMEKLFEKHSAASSPLFKGIVIAAAVVIIFGIAMAIKPVREPVIAFIGSIFGNTVETGTGENTGIPETEETEPAVVTTEQITESETEPTETEPEYENDIERYLLMLESKDNRQKAFSYLYNIDRVETVFDYCVNALWSKDKSSRIQNCAGDFLYHFDELLQIYPNILEYRDYYMELDNYKGDPADDTRYIKWFYNYYEILKTEANKTLKKDAVFCSYQYRLLNLTGFDEWLLDTEPAEAAELTLKKMFDIFNCVYSGIPLPDDETVALSEPYPEALRQQTEEIWGDEKRELVMSSYTLTAYQDMFKKYANTSFTDTVIGQTKYFITANDHVYLTRAKETDTDAHTYEFLQITKINEPDITRTTIYGCADVLYDGEIKTYWFDFPEAYHPNGSRCIMNSGEIMDFAMEYRGDATVIKAINALKSGKDIYSQYPSHCIYSMKNVTAEYILKRYFTEDNELERAAMSQMYYQILATSYNYSVFYDLLDEKTRTALFDCDGKYICNLSINSDAELWAPWLSRFAEALKPYAEDRYRQEMEENFYFTYRVLETAGFENYKPEPFDIAYRSRAAVSDVLRLVNALHYGIGIYDDTSVTYGNKELGNLEYPPAVADAIKDNGVDYWEGIRTQAQGFKTVSEWKEYYKRILPEDVVDEVIKTTGRLIIADGIVYTGGFYGDSVFTLDILELRKISEKDGRAVLAANVNIPFGMGSYKQEVTFEVVDKGGQIRIVGGTFVEIFLQDGVTKGKAALSVYEAIYAQEILLECNYNTKSMRAYYGDVRRLNSIDELHAVSEYDRDFINAEVPDEMFPLYMNIGWEETTSWKWALGFILPEKYYDVLITNNKNVVMIGYNVLISAANVKAENTPAIGSADKITVTDVYNALKVISETDEKITVSLDFIKNGSQTVTYTFEMEKGLERYTHLLINGGTFLTDVLDK